MKPIIAATKWMFIEKQGHKFPKLSIWRHYGNKKRHKIAKNKDLYYEALGHSQSGWHEGEEDAVPFIKYLLGTILAAYKDFEDRFEIVEEKLPAIEMVRKVTQKKIGKFNKQDIRELCPALSVSSIEGSLRKLVAEGELRREGTGKSTFYVRLK